MVTKDFKKKYRVNYKLQGERLSKFSNGLRIEVEASTAVEAKKIVERDYPGYKATSARPIL